MDVSGVGQSPAGFSAVPETALDPQRSGQAGAPEKSGQVRQAPLDLLSDARLGRELMALGLRPDAAKLLAARALMLQQGRLDLTMLLDVERSLHALASPGAAEAEAAAFLVARRLPATPETVSWVTGRHHATEPSGMRMLGIIQRFAAAMAARSGLPAVPLEVPAPGVPSQPAAETPATDEPAAHPTPAPAKAPSNAGGPPASTPPPAPAPQAPVPVPAAAQAAPAAEAGADTAGAPDGEAAPARPATPPGAPAPAMPPAKAPAPQSVPTSTPQPAPTPSHPAPLPAATLSALVTAAGAELPEAAAAEPERDPAAAPAPAPMKAPSAERELLARLQALTLPEGKAKDMEAALRRLVQALRPQEADLAQGAVAEARERLSATATKAIAKAPHDANVRAVHDELRFQQVNSARHEGQTPHEIVIPVWWKGGSGEIRVQERPEGAARRSEEASAPVRVVMALETPHLGALRIDLLLAQRQVNCLVAVQDQGAADFLSPRLTELRSAIEETGVHVHGLGMKPFTPVDGRPGPGDAKGVDYYG